MPTAPERACPYPGCRARIGRRRRYCKQHETARRERIREQGNGKRYYADKAWQALRLAWLREHPLCQCDQCREGKLRIQIATVVDHIIQVSKRPDLRLDRTNLRSMAKRCHDRHTALTQSFGRNGMEDRVCNPSN